MRTWSVLKGEKGVEEAGVGDEKTDLLTVGFWDSSVGRP